MKCLRHFLVLILLVGANAAEAGPDATTLMEWMTETFDSSAQAEADSAYYNIRLDMTPIRTNRDDALWLYVEQAVASMVDKPYRQRVYRVTEGE